MAYTPTEWQTGDIITATKLNNMEQGIANAGGVLQVGVNNNILDKTWKEISDAAYSVLLMPDGEYYLCIGFFSEDGDYGVSYWAYNMQAQQQPPAVYIADSPDGYPVKSN